MFRNSLLIIFLAAVVMAGCNLSSPYYERVTSIPQNQWNYQYKPGFKFDITDTNETYDLYFVIRHTNAYPFSNIWLMIYTKKPGDTAYERERVEIPLAEKSGKWLGRGMGEIWEQRMPLTGNGSMVFNKKGTYEIRFMQDMRINPLPEVLQVGLRIEKNGPRQIDTTKTKK